MAFVSTATDPPPLPPPPPRRRPHPARVRCRLPLFDWSTFVFAHPHEDRVYELDYRWMTWRRWKKSPLAQDAQWRYKRIGCGFVVAFKLVV